MTDSSRSFQPILRDLEAIQVRIGNVQLALLDVAASEGSADCDAGLHAALIRLEGVQRGVGEVQVMLLRHAAGEEDRPETLAANDGVEPMTDATDLLPYQPEARVVTYEPIAQLSSATTGSTLPPAALPSQPAHARPETAIAPVAQEDVSDLRAWLERRGLRVKSVRTPSGVDAMADEAALFLGANYATLEPFYAQVKQRLGGSYFYKWFKREGYGPEAMSAICELGHKLHKGGFLAQFRNVKNDKTILFEPITDGQVTGFLTGGWLERYVFQVVREAVAELAGRWSDSQALLDATVVLPNCTETELDVLIALPAGRVLWFECKTGGWQTCVKQFQTVNRQHLKLPSHQAALVLADRLDQAEQASAAALASMSVLHLTELPTWLTTALRP